MSSGKARDPASLRVQWHHSIVKQCLACDTCDFTAVTKIELRTCDAGHTGQAWGTHSQWSATFHMRIYTYDHRHGLGYMRRLLCTDHHRPIVSAARQCAQPGRYTRRTPPMRRPDLRERPL